MFKVYIIYDKVAGDIWFNGYSMKFIFTGSREARNSWSSSPDRNNVEDKYLTEEYKASRTKYSKPKFKDQTRYECREYKVTKVNKYKVV